MSETNEKFWTPGRIIATLVVGAAIAVTGFFLAHSREGDATARVVLPGTAVSSSAPVTAQMPEDYPIPTTDGNTIQLSSYRGKVLVLDFWATWCPPCRDEIPQLVRIARENRARGVEVVGLHIDDQGRSSPEAIQKFLQQFNVNYTVGLASNELFVAYLGSEETAIPQTLVFDRSGKAIAHLIGYDQGHAQKLDEAVNKALAN